MTTVYLVKREAYLQHFNSTRLNGVCVSCCHFVTSSNSASVRVASSSIDANGLLLINDPNVHTRFR